MPLNPSQSTHLRKGTIRVKPGKALHDLEGKELEKCVTKFNRRLTKRFSTCHIDLPQGNQRQGFESNKCEEHLQSENQCIRGGVRLNFMFQDSIKVINTICVDGEEGFITDFKFSTKSVLVVPLCSNHTVLDLVKLLEERFRMVKNEDEPKQRLRIFERELSVTLQDVFYREVAAQEQPLELFFLWKINAERKSLVVTDHDPNENRYDNMDLDELESRLDKINKEEISKIKKVEESYNHTKEVMKQLMNDNLVVDTNTISKSLAEEEEDLDKITGFALELHEDHFDDKFDEGTLKSSPLSIEQRIRRQSETLQPGLLKSCSFKLEVNDRPIYGLSQEEAISLIKSFEADPELKRSKIRLTVIPTALIPPKSQQMETM